jgi:hypothetical protein
MKSSISNFNAQGDGLRDSIRPLKRHGGRMKLILFIVLGACAVSLFPSCLKDQPYLNVSDTEPIVEFGQSAANGIFGPNGYFGAYTFQGDTAGGPVITYDTAVALVLASPQVLSDSIQVTIAIDTTQLSAFNAAEGDSITLLPANLYSLPQTVIGISPGYRIGNIPVTIDMPAFPAAHQYGLPISIVSAVDLKNPGTQIVVSGNSGKFMWLFQR